MSLIIQVHNNMCCDFGAQRLTRARENRVGCVLRVKRTGGTGKLDTGGDVCLSVS
jgi:hypothetical protein